MKHPSIGVCLSLLFLVNQHALAAEKHRLNIPAQPLVSALNELTEVTGTSSFFRFEIVEGKESSAVNGWMSVSEALSQLLSGTNLDAEVSEDSVIRLIKKPDKKPQLLIASKQIEDDTSAQSNKQNAIEQVRVFGSRYGIQNAQTTKRNSDVIVDTIAANEVGEFPDQNVAESLQQVTGIAISRGRGGEGDFVTVRGLGAQFNTVTYNNRLIATENTGREFSFDVIASELISRAEIFKTFQASQRDGSISGLINVESAKPYDNEGFHASGKLLGQYESLSEGLGASASFVLSNTWGDDFGLLGSFSYQQRDSRSDIIDVGFVNMIDSLGGAPLNRATQFNSINTLLSEQDRERIGGTLAAQFKPTDNTEVNIDLLYTSLKGDSTGSGFGFFAGQANNLRSDLPFQVLPLANQETDLLVGFTASAQDQSPSSLGNIVDLIAQRNTVDSETFSIGANLNFKINQRITSQLDFAYSNAQGQRDLDNPAFLGSGSFFVVSVPNAVVTQSFSGGPIPNISISVPDGSPSGRRVPLSEFLLNPQDTRLHFAKTAINRAQDSIYQVQFDNLFEYNESTTVSFGFNLTDRTKDIESLNNFSRQCGSSEFPICTRAFTIESVLRGATAELFTNTDGSFLDNLNANIERTFPTFSVSALEEIFDQLGAVTGEPSFLSLQRDPSTSVKIKERILGVYVQLNVEGVLFDLPYRSDFGIRLAGTRTSARGSRRSIESASITTINSPDSSLQSFELSPARSASVDNRYFDLLPSFNFTLNLSDNILARASLSQTIARPSLDDLTPSGLVDNMVVSNSSFSVGNPELTRARSNNLDFSLEYYGDKLSMFGSAFIKDVDDFIVTNPRRETILVPNVNQVDGAERSVQAENQNVVFTVTRPTNGEQANILGLELSAQYLFDNGVGLLGNVAFIDSKATANGVSGNLLGSSDFTAALQTFYTSPRFTARLSLHHRSGYQFEFSSDAGLPTFFDDFTQVDASLEYKIGEQLTLFFEGINLFEEDSFRYSGNTAVLDFLERNGARYLFGVRSKF